LAGISRAIVMGLLGTVREEPFSVEEMRAAEEVFVTGTTTEVTALVQLDGKPIGAGMPGPVASRAAREYEALWRRESAGREA